MLTLAILRLRGSSRIRFFDFGLGMFTKLRYVLCMTAAVKKIGEVLGGSYGDYGDYGNRGYGGWR